MGEDAVKEAPKPTYQDARLLLEIAKQTQDTAFQKAREWFFASLPEEPITLEEFEQKFPKGSEGSSHLDFLSSHFETAGVLVKYKLLNEDLYFDRYFVEPYWDRSKKIIRGEREKYHPAIAENFEWLARRAAAWRRKQASRKK